MLKKCILQSLIAQEITRTAVSFVHISQCHYYGHPRSTKKQQNWLFDDMHSFIAVMAKRFPITLAITVGQPVMIATGPLGGYPVETGIVIALGADVVVARRD